MAKAITTTHPSRSGYYPKRDSKALSQRGPVPLEVRIRARASYAARLHELERIIDGTSMQNITKKIRLKDESGTWADSGKREITSVSPNAKEKLMALQELAKLGKVHDTDSGVEASEEQVARAVVAALTDPTVRLWLMSAYPEVVRDLAVTSQIDNPSEAVTEDTPELTLSQAVDLGTTQDAE